MHPCAPVIAISALLATSTSALNIVLNNDDGFGAASIREFYRALVADGHEVVMVAPASQQSSQGGRSVFTDSGTLYGPTQYNIVPAGAPAVGRDPFFENIWYYNETPAVCTSIALDYVIPQFYNNRTTDLGSFVWKLSGTGGAANSSVSRNIPAIAFSAGNLVQRSYFEINQTTLSGQPDPATIAGRLSTNIVRVLANNKASGQRLLPISYGLNVNFAEIDTLSVNPKCVSPTFYQTRFTNGATTDVAVRNATTDVFRYGDLSTEGVNTCINGDCNLPGETEVVNAGCYGIVSVFTIDYSGPSGSLDTQIRAKLGSVLKRGVPTGVVRKRGLSRSAYEKSVKSRHD